MAVVPRASQGAPRALLLTALVLALAACMGGPAGRAGPGDADGTTGGAGGATAGAGGGEPGGDGGGGSPCAGRALRFVDPPAHASRQRPLILTLELCPDAGLDSARPVDLSIEATYAGIAIEAPAPVPDGDREDRWNMTFDLSRVPGRIDVSLVVRAELLGSPRDKAAVVVVAILDG